jgi:hypothetical protein
MDMKNVRLVPTLLAVILVFAACSIHVPWEVLDDYDGVRVIMRITPDDADVLLNGRFIGAAYEYASAGIALRLASRENELVFRKKGYREKIVDLRAYPNTRITLNYELLPQAIQAREEPAAPAVAEEPADEAQSEPVKPLPVEQPDQPAERFQTQVALTVTPEEAAVYIDTRFWGLAPAAGKAMFLRLPPGKYVIVAFKPGFRAFSQEVIVPKQETFSLVIALQR